MLKDLTYYQNYHKHTSLSHRYNKDSPLVYNDYFKHMKNNEYPQIYSTVEHGWQGNYFKIYDELEKFNKKNNTNIKFVFGTEAYWVNDRFEKDSANNHIVLLAKNEYGRKKLNRAIYDSYESGYYYKNRMDLDILLSLPKSDIFVTSACIGFWTGYAINDDSVDFKEIDNTILKLFNHFDDFYLEVQANNTEYQKVVNKHILELSNKYNIPIIAGCDTHVIDESQMADRDYLLKSNHIFYEDEDDNYMDFPSLDSLIDRFQKQGILNDDEIYIAINNTNKILEFDDIILNRDMKVPIPERYKHLTQEERNEVFVNILRKEWKIQSDDINKDKFDEYISEIKLAISEITSCDMVDYFLMNYHAIELGINKYGGKLTQSGRGSAVSMYINKLLGFTNVDKVNAQVKMYAERFLTKERVLESKTPPDIDFNVNNREPFILAQDEVVGKKSFDLIALGTLKYKSAFKMYARANDLEPQLANDVSSQISKYEEALKYADDEHKDEIDIFKYVSKKDYGHLIDGCQQYRGIVDTLKVHPCSTLAYDGDIIEDVGVIMVRSETTKKETYVALIESGTIDAFAFLKNDWLKVDSIGIIYDTYDEIGIEPMTVNKLVETVNNDKATWDIYANGYTMCLNQCEQPKATEKIMRYKPQNISELCQWISAIRPAFQSMYSIFERREKFKYGIKALDDLIQNEYCKSSFILYQETLMHILGFAGFEMSETYDIIKAISKKKEYVIKDAKKKFIVNFKQAILNTNETNNIEVAEELSQKVWTIIESNSAYGFNSSHAYSMSIDSVTSAYLKAHYPLEFYKVCLQRYTDKDDKDKVSAIKKEMLKLGVGIKAIKYGDDNRVFSIDRESNSLNQTMKSIKNMQKIVPQIFYEMKDNKYDDFIDLYKELSTYKVMGKTINKTSLDILIRLNFFSEFGSIDYLQYCVSVYNRFSASKVLNKNKLSPYELKCLELCYEKSTDKQFRGIDNDKFIGNLLNSRQYEKDTLTQLIKNEIELMGYTNIIDKSKGDDYYCVEGIEANRYGTMFAKLYRINDGTTSVHKVDKQTFKDFPFEAGAILECMFKDKQKSKKETYIDDNGAEKTRWIKIDEWEWVLTTYCERE